MANKKTIAVDIDDVLSKTAEGFTKFSDERWGGKHNPEDMQENWKEFWKVPLDIAIRRAKEFHSSDAVKYYQPVDEAQGVLKAHSDEWLERFYPGIFESIYYAGIWDGDEQVYHKLKLTKSDLCGKLDCDYLIDDQLKHCIGAAEAGIKALLFGDYKWNQYGPLPSGMARVRDWTEVKEYFSV